MRGIAGRPRGIAWLTRALGLDGNPLRRASDRAEAWLRVGLVAIFLIVGPAAALGAGHWAYHAEITGAAVQARRTHQVKAVLFQPALATAGPARAGGSRPAGIRARWDGEGSSTRAGEVFAEVMTLALVALVLLATLRLTVMFLNRRRLAAWERSWSRVGPRWTEGRLCPRRGYRRLDGAGGRVRRPARARGDAVVRCPAAGPAIFSAFSSWPSLGPAIYLVLPGLIAVFGSWPRLSALSPIWFTAALAAEVASFICNFALQRLALRTKGWFAVVTAGLVGNAVTNSLPGGDAAGAAVQFNMLSGLLILAGVRPGDAFLATLAYRVASYWLPLLAGPLAYVLFRRRYGTRTPRPADQQGADAG